MAFPSRAAKIGAVPGYKPKAHLLEVRKTISFKSTTVRDLERAARKAGMTFSAWARGVLLKAAGRVK